MVRYDDILVVGTAEVPVCFPYNGTAVRDIYVDEKLVKIAFHDGTEQLYWREF